MAATVTLIKDGYDLWGKHMVQPADVVLGTYATGGVAITPRQFGLKTFRGVQIIGGNAASAGYNIVFDTTNSKLVAYRSAGFTPAGTNSVPTFTGAVLTAHRHVLHFQTSAAANAVTAAANSLRTPAAAFDVAGVADSLGEGGVVDASGGTPSGTVSAPTFTGTAVAAGAMVEVANSVSLAAITVRVLAIGV